jgi:hypothetical protein
LAELPQHLADRKVSRYARQSGDFSPPPAVACSSDLSKRSLVWPGCTRSPSLASSPLGIGIGPLSDPRPRHTRGKHVAQSIRFQRVNANRK